MTGPSLVLMGGGLDSTAALIWIRKNSAVKQLRSIFFRYGQRAERQEFEAVKHFAQKYDAPVFAIDLQLSRIAQSDILKQPTRGTNKLEGRNAIFTLMAATLAATWGSPFVFIGYHKEPESAPFPDATITGMEAMQQAINQNYHHKALLIAPFATATRTKILAWAYKQDSEIITHTHTCYEGIAGGCGVCVHCKQREIMIKNITEGTDLALPENR